MKKPNNDGDKKPSSSQQSGTRESVKRYSQIPDIGNTMKPPAKKGEKNGK